MFEEEAIRHAFESTIGVECLVKPVEDFTYEELSDEQQEKAYDFKDGAEFSYNKCKEELNQKGLALQSDMDKTIEQNIALKKELDKANEWLYVKDELPPENVPLNIITFDKDKKRRLWEGEYKGGNGQWWTGYFNHFIDVPYAWKEIVLPEHPKESE